MSDLLDIILLGGGAYYIGSRLQGEEDNDSFKRIAIGTAVGVPAALKGPELYDSLTEAYEENGSEETRNRTLAAAVGGLAGYAIGDKLLGEDKDNYNP